MSTATLALAATLALGACGLVGGGSAEKPGAPAAEATQGAEGSQADGGETAPGPGTDLGKVVATREIQVARSSSPNIPIKIELYELRRDNGFVVVNLRVTNMAPEGANRSQARWQIAQFFSGEDGFSMKGVYLVDRKNKKQHLIARTPEDKWDKTERDERYLGSHGLAGVFAYPQQPVSLYATFGAPPDDVTAVDVFVPNVPVFENVPLG
jgi:hypothetical protein